MKNKLETHVKQVIFVLPQDRHSEGQFLSAKERILPGADYLRSYKPTEQGSEQGVTVWIVTIVLRKYNKTICECYIKLAMDQRASSKANLQ